MSIASASLTCHVAARDPLLLDYVKSAARAAARPVRALHLQSLLHLPRIADARGVAPLPLVKPVLTELAQELPVKEEWFVEGADSSPRLSIFQEISSATACDVMRRFHYLRSPRTDGRAYGLSTSEGQLVALCVSSPLDIERLQDLLVGSRRSPEFARVISRVFVFDGAPNNSISYMLSRAAHEERCLGVTDLLTYVNPNMGFTGSSYRAAGWCLLGTEPGTKYRYIDGRYITDRELAALFGAHNDEGYQRLLGPRFSVSAMPLMPLVVFHTVLR